MLFTHLPADPDSSASPSHRPRSLVTRSDRLAVAWLASDPVPPPEHVPKNEPSSKLS